MTDLMKQVRTKGMDEVGKVRSKGGNERKQKSDVGESF